MTVQLPGTGTGTANVVVSTDEITTLNAGGVSSQSMQRVGLALRTGANTAVDVPGDTTNGVDVDVTRLPALPAGTNNIGDVDVLTLPALVAGTANIGDVDVLTMPTVTVTGTVAHDGGDSGNPQKIGVRAETDLAASTMVADGDRTDLYGDIDGVLITKPMCPFNNILVERVTDTGGTSTASTVFGATANARNMITSIVVYNDSVTNGFIDFRDGTAGTVLLTLPLPAKGGAVFNPPVPIRQTTVNTAFAYDVNAATTTVYISLIGFKSKA